MQYLIVDCPFNQANYRDLIGQLYDKPPAYAVVESIPDGSLPLKLRGSLGGLGQEQSPTPEPTQPFAPVGVRKSHRVI